LEWDTVRGWLDSCQPVVCGQLESPAYAEALQDMAETWFFPDTVEYQCSSGYEVEFYGDNWWQSPTVPSNGSGLDARLLRFRCSAQGTFENLTGQRCVPVCGDGMLVPIDHLPQNELREQCDDGNLDQGDGCDGQCHVESGFICVGGDRNQPDRCSPATVSADSSMILSMSGARAASIDEVSLATLLVISKVFQCPRRDLEILEVAAANASTSTSVGQLHTSRQAMQVRFRIKISNPQILSLDDIQAEMANPRLFIPKVVAAFLQTSSLQDLYLTVVEVQAPTFQGQVPKVELMGFSDYVALVATVGVSLLSYACLIGLVTPAIYWCLFIMRRPHRLQGHLDLVPLKHKSGWVVGLCECCRFKVTCCSLLFFLPARLAYTWDTVGILPYWRGVRQALMCCGLYLMGCWPCGAFIAGQRRSDLKDFLGFGDGVKSNFEVVDICYYLMCPICSVVQEAAHVDMVFAAVRTAVQEEAEKARKRLEDPDYEDEERPAEAPTLQAMLDEGFNAALDTAVGALD